MAARDGDRRQVPPEERGGLPEEEPVESGLRSHGHPLDVGQEDQPEAEEDGQGQPQGAVVLDPGVSDDAHDQERAQPARSRGAQQQGGGRFAPRQQEDQGDAGKRRVGDGVSEQALLPEHGEGADRAVDDPQGGGAQGNRLQRVIRG
jgi:hypothetical protein